MNESHEFRLAQRMRGIAPSAVREILRVTQRPEVISLAGGLPAPELFPVAAIAEAFARVLATDGGRALQYGVTEGHGPLREWIASYLGTRGIHSSVEHLLVTSGSQQGIDLVARVLLDPGAVVVTENPTYVAALQVFSAHQVKVVAVGSDDEGMCVDELPALLARHPARLIYLCPDFQNPKGTTLSAARRRRLIEIASAHRIPILEDDPYSELRFRGVAPPPLAALDEEGLVIRLGTFSKILAPGMRIGWIHASPSLLPVLALARQACDLHTSTLSQHALVALFQQFDFAAHLARLRAVYGARCDAMRAALEHELPELRIVQPEGGLFYWLELPAPVRDDDLFAEAVRQNLAVVPGHGFFVGAEDHRFVRLNFSRQDEATISVGVARLARAIRALRDPREAALPG
jgi:2-aminoadipate transaminase